MKKFIGFFFTVCFLLQINNLSYGQDDRWVYVTENNSVTFYIDKLTVKCDNYGNLVVWIKLDCFSDCERLSGRTLDYSLIKTKFYSREKISRDLSSVFYYTDGSSFSPTYDRFEDYNIVPESAFENVYDYVFSNFNCK